MTNPQTTPKQKLSELKVVVDQFIPCDELRVHPTMFEKLKEMFLEVDNARGI